MHLFNEGVFALHSGELSSWKIDCDSLTDEDWSTLARMAINVLPDFGKVVGVPKGGLSFANALKKYTTEGSPVLIADDVLTTGGSMEEIRKGDKDVLGIVVFARKKPPDWVKALFTYCEA